jgi:hypothetical protein
MSVLYYVNLEQLYLKDMLAFVVYLLFINVKVALFAAFSISAGNLSSISASLTSFSLHSMCTNAIMWNCKCFTKRNENFFDVSNKQMSIQD